MESAITSLAPENQFANPEDWREFTKYLTETNRFILTDYWENFIRIVVRTSRKRAITLKKGVRLVRARIGTAWVRFEDKILEDDLTIVDTSSDETKNRLSQFVMDEKGDIKRRSIESYTPQEKEEYIWGDINFEFAKPVSPNDSPLKYLPTQYLSETFKTQGYDGIAYKSSLTATGHNVALFNPNKARCIGCRMFEIKELKYKFEESGNAIGLSADGKVRYPRVVGIRPIDTHKSTDKES